MARRSSAAADAVDDAHGFLAGAGRRGRGRAPGGSSASRARRPMTLSSPRCHLRAIAGIARRCWCAAPRGATRRSCAAGTSKRIVPRWIQARAPSTAPAARLDAAVGHRDRIADLDAPGAAGQRRRRAGATSSSCLARGDRRLLLAGEAVEARRAPRHAGAARSSCARPSAFSWPQEGARLAHLLLPGACAAVRAARRAGVSIRRRCR